jgi:hypothetical protein
VFLANIPYGFLAGSLISAYLPEGDASRMDCRAPWLAVGLLAL